MIAFTRYLYVKQDVETALILSLLDKDKERSLFWAYELFHSGFYHETIRLLWNIYYGFYALHAPSLESYFKKRISHDPTNEELEKYVGMMVTNLLVSAFDTQVFRLSGLVHHNDEILTSSYDELEKHLHDRNYLLIARSLFHLCQYPKKIAGLKKKLSSFFKEKGILRPVFVLPYYNVSWFVVFLSHIVLYLQEIDVNTNQTKSAEKKIYIAVDEKILHEYRNIEISEHETPHILFPKLVKFSPQSSEFYTAFISPHQSLILNEYRYNWLCNAYHMTPLWKWRVNQYGGTYDQESDTILWSTEEDEENFYSNYGYDVDEQPLEIQNNNIPSCRESQCKSLESFYLHYNTL